MRKHPQNDPHTCTAYRRRTHKLDDFDLVHENAFCDKTVYRSATCGSISGIRRLPAPRTVSAH
eukprot:5280463-Prymnesium_polylepis.1